MFRGRRHSTLQSYIETLQRVVDLRRCPEISGTAPSDCEQRLSPWSSMRADALRLRNRRKRSEYQGDVPRPISLRRKKALTALAIRALLI